MSRVSVVIPSYSRPVQTAAAVRSALTQDLDDRWDIEVVVVDDASPEPLVLDRSTNQLRVLRLERNQGASGARNAGLLAATGRYIALLDSDDLWLTGKLRAQLAMHEALVREGRDASTLVVSSGFYMPRRSGGSLEKRVPIEADSAVLFASACWHCPGSTFLADRSVFDRVGLFDTSLRRLEDFEWFARFGLAGGQLRVVPFSTVAIAPSGLAPPIQMKPAVERCRQSLDSGALAGFDEECRRAFRAYLEYEMAASYIGAGDITRGCTALLRSLQFKPRTQLAPGRFWERTNEIPKEIVAMFRQMKANEHAVTAFATRITT